MAKLNGTEMLVYCDDTVIAYQKECAINWEQDLPPATTKASSGWEEHINGTRRVTCDFTSLFSTTGLSDGGLIGQITGRESVMLVIDGGGFPIVGKANLKNVSINAAQEDPAGISGAFNFTGGCWMLAGDFVQLITEWTNTDYNTFTTSGTSITSAIETTDGFGSTDGFSVTDEDVFKVIFFLTLTSGQLPTFSIIESGVGAKSNQVASVEGVNIITLTATATVTGLLRSQSTGATNFSTTKIYIFKV